MAGSSQTSHISIGTRPPDNDHESTTTQKRALYSDKLRTNVAWDNRLKRNVLEIILEKDAKGPFNVSAEDIVKVMV